MSSTAHICYEQPVAGETLSGSANWAIDNGTPVVVEPRVGTTSRSLSQLARLAFVLAVSSMSSGPDPWFETQQQRVEFAMNNTFRTNSRRRITPLEARRMALDILHRAEAERAAVAQAEAQRGIDWEEAS